MAEEYSGPTLDEVQAMIVSECDSIKELLIQKNMAYGNSAISPKRIFSRSSSVEQIMVRIDDKLSRIANQDNVLDNDDAEDAVKDLIGYLVLLRIAQTLNKA
jgi:hypothetical protein